MRSDSPVHSELTARPPRPPAETNHNRAHNLLAAASIPDMASIADNNVRPRPERACDLCRRRKTKCDGSSAPDNICSNCAQNNQYCTYLCAYMHTLLSFHVLRLPLAKPLVREVHQRRSSSPFSLFATPSIIAYTVSLLQLCLWPRGPSGEGGSTAQAGAYHTSLLAPRPSELECPITQLRPEVDFTQHLGPPIVRDSWRVDAQLSISAPRPPVKKKKSHPTSLNPLDHSVKAQRKSLDAEPGDTLSSDDEDPPFECAKRKLNLPTPGHSDDETEKDCGDTGADRGTRLYGKSADIHLVGPTMFWKCQHIMDVTPPDPQPEAHPPDPGTFPKIRRPIYWGPPFPVSDHLAILLYVTMESPNLHQFSSGNWNGKASI